MPTNNLSSKSLGSVKLQTGIGTPDHLANISDFYVDISNATAYINQQSDSGYTTNWNTVKNVCSASMYNTGTTAIVFSSINNWISFSGVSYNWSGETNNGLTRSNGVLTVSNGGSGLYMINADVSLLYNNILNEIDVGISINKAVPTIGAYYRVSLHDATFSLNKSMGLNINKNLNAGDTVEMTMRVLTSTGTITLKFANLAIEKI